jgi:hypothetical protein
MMWLVLLYRLGVCAYLNLYSVPCGLRFRSVGLRVLVCCVCVCIESVVVVLECLLRVLETFVLSQVCCSLSGMLNVYATPG